MNIALVSDCHLTEDPQKALREAYTHPCLEQYLQKLQALGPDLVLGTGDLAQDPTTRGPYEALKALFDRYLDCPYLLIMGNHDHRGLLQEVFGNLRSELCADKLAYTYRMGKHRLICLDSAEDGRIDGQLGAKQLDWLDGKLTEDPHAETLIVLHHPPLDTPMAWFNQRKLLLNDREELWQVVHKHKHVKAVLYGHQHHKTAQERSGITLYGAPSTCFQFEDDPQNQVSYEPVEPYLISF